MGYTHYWTLKPGVNNPEKFAKAVELFKACWDKAPKTFSWRFYLPDPNKDAWITKVKRFRKSALLKGWDGKGQATISDTKICFNGNAKYDLDHETFRISLDIFNRELEEWEKRPNGEIWDFCKTAEKPYDLAVCLALLSFKEVFGEDFEYSSDGITRESIKDPENLEYWARINYKPTIEAGWKRAYRIFDNVVAQYRAESLA